MTPAPERIFLNWDRPLIESASAWVIARFAQNGEVDLSAWACVTPTARSGQLLLGELVDACTRASVAFVPPVMLSPGEIAAWLAPPTTPPAHPLLCTTAWVESLQSLRETLQPLLPHAPPAEQLQAWRAAAGVVARASSMLGAAGLFAEHVLPLVQSAPGIPDETRLQALAAAQAAYRTRLAAWGLHDPDLWGAHVLTEEQDLRERPLLLVGAANLPVVSQKLLRRAKGETVVLIGAPVGEAAAFDALGQPHADAWNDRPIEFASGIAAFCRDAGHGADKALSFLAALEGRFSAQEICVIATEPSAASALERAGDGVRGLRFRRAPGRTLAATRPGHLLAATSAILQSGRMADFASLLRHLDVSAWVERSHDVQIESLFSRLDRYAARQLPGVLAEAPEDEATGSGFVRSLRTLRSELLGTLTSREPQPLRAWAEPIRAMLERVYAGTEGSRRDPSWAETARACEVIASALEAMERAPDAAGIMPASDAISLLLQSVGSSPMPVEPDGQAIEMVGWLEAAMDPSPAMLVLGMNEGLLTSDTPADPILPEGLRRLLGLETNAEKFARDAFVLSALLSSRNAMQFICLGRDGNGDPLTPSRLLLRPSDEQELARRAIRACDGDPPDAVRVRSTLSAADRDAFTDRPVPQNARIASMSVSAFRDYLKSPYGFYVQHVLRAESMERPAPEMDGGAFGTLVHEAAAVLIEPQLCACEDIRVLEAALHGRLETVARQRFGARPDMAVRAQIRIAAMRLARLAEVQAQRAAEGWSVVAVEWMPGEAGSSLIVDGEPMGLRGRVDRIDRHRSTGQFAILDYKTSDSPLDPVKSHHSKARGWFDLQLPLYRTLAASVIGNDIPELGYVTLPRDRHECRVRLTGWEADALASAEDRAADVIRQIRSGQLEVMGEATRLHGRLAWVCGAGVLEEQNESDGGPDDQEQDES